ncbi:MAG: hypothetical protein KBS85_06175 [Lachnospiraceae bacterium]|nr:hypothetical protein [Candidatus Merdinaster equi]
MRVVKEKQDLTFLKWSHIRNSSGTAGTFLKSQSELEGVKKYYKLSNFDPVKGIVGHECVNEIIVDRLLTVLGVDHLDYELINADIEIEGVTHSTYLCSSNDFKNKGESKVALDDYYRVNSLNGESHYDFCVRNGWKKYIDEMIVIDYLILNRDRHGANIEVLRNARAHTLRIAPLFDHGLSLIFSCSTKHDAKSFDVLQDKKCRNFIGSNSCYENLLLVKDNKPELNQLKERDKEFIFQDIEVILPQEYVETIWSMIWKRYQIYENL